MIIPTDDLPEAAAYKLLIGSVVPRAIAWVSTSSTSGVGNIAPVSFFTVGRQNPADVLSISLQPRADGETLKDTFVNIRDTNEFVVNIASIGQADAVHRSAYEFETDVDEFEALGLEKAASEVISVLRVSRGARSPSSAWSTASSRCRRCPTTSSGAGRVSTCATTCTSRGAGSTRRARCVRPARRRVHLVDNIFTTPLPDELLASMHGARMRRLDGLETGFSPIETPLWSASGSTRPSPP